MATTTSAPSADTAASVSDHRAGNHKGHRLTKVGSVSVDLAKGGGTLTVWYCQDEHKTFIDTVS